MNNLSARQVNDLNRINEKTKAMAFGNIVKNMIDEINDVAATGTPVNAVNATKVLTFTGVVKDGETVTINNPGVPGTDVYEFLADAAQIKTAVSNIGVNILANTTRATNTLTLPTQPTAGDTMSIGTTVYTFVDAGTADAAGKISVGSDLATAKLAIVAAINGTDGLNIPQPLLTASDFAANVCTLTAIVGGTAGNSIGTTETFTAVGNVFSSATLATGADCSAANAITALVAAITSSDTQGVGAADGAGDTIDLTADVAGVVGNAIVIGETLPNASFAGAATLLSGGVDGTVGMLGENLVDSSYLYVLTADNTTAGKNWRRVSLGSAY